MYSQFVDFSQLSIGAALGHYQKLIDTSCNSLPVKMSMTLGDPGVCKDTVIALLLGDQ